MSIRYLVILFAFLIFCSFCNAQDTPFRIIEKPNPERPSDYGTLDLQATASLRVEFLATGEIGEVKVVKEIPVRNLTALAVNAAKRIKFEPEQKGGKFVNVTNIVLYRYGSECGGWCGGVKNSDIPKLQDAPLRIVEQPKPEIPKDDGMLDVQGFVRLRVEFLETGEIGKVELKRSVPISSLNEAAITASRKIKFIAERKGGKFVDSVKFLEYSFSWRSGGWTAPKLVNVAKTDTVKDDENQ